MKRFYTRVSTGPALDGSGFAILLDDRPVRTPAKNLMTAPTLKLADAIAAEWDAQKDIIDHDMMPLTQLLTTAIDRTQSRAEITDSVIAYTDSDLLCYIAPDPQDLHDELIKTWGPHLDWFEKTYGVKLQTTHSLIRLDQPKAAHDAVRTEIDGMDLHHFTAMQTATAVTGSIVLGLALGRGAISADDAWRCALCEELHYERTHDLERHGHDPIEEKRRVAVKRDLEACAAYIKLTQA